MQITGKIKQVKQVLIVKYKLQFIKRMEKGNMKQKRKNMIFYDTLEKAMKDVYRICKIYMKELWR